MLAVFRGAVELNLPVNLVCTIAVAENFVGPEAYRNSDIIKSLKVIRNIVFGKNNLVVFPRV